MRLPIEPNPDIYIYRKPGWPHFEWDHKRLLNLLAKVRSMQGKILGKMTALGFGMAGEAILKTLTLDVLKSSEIEGEILHPEQVRSSIARRLGMDVAGMVPSGRNVDGVVDMMLDATQNFNELLTKERLCQWHIGLFPSEVVRYFSILVGDWRDDANGPMQVVSGPMGKERVHFQAPASSLVPKEMAQFLDWFNSEGDLDPVIKAGVAHFWFITIHPFDDGNGRIARALTDLLLTRADGVPQRFFSMSAQINKERKGYYEILEASQCGKLDITNWLEWFLTCLHGALESTEETMQQVVYRHHFWVLHGPKSLNERQKFMVIKLLDDFFGKLTSSKWAKMTKCSQDTALRDIQDLMDKEILRKTPGGGRSTSYELEDLPVSLFRIRKP